MSTIKSFSVGFGDMFYINHGSDNFTIIDCFLNDESADVILDQLKPLARAKGINRFISTHPDEDHVLGLDLLEDEIGITNFYCVKNKATKVNRSDSFDKYCELRDSSKAYYIYKGCRRRWMNDEDDTRGSSGINILWPDTNNEDFKAALAEAELGGSPNNMSAIVKYEIKGGGKFIWFGDLHMDFMKKIESELNLTQIDVAFAPHHGRRTGRIPSVILNKISPKIIVIGEAASEHLEYYSNYNTITQNTAGDVIFDCVDSKIHVFTSKPYEVDYLDNEFSTLPASYSQNSAFIGTYYIGTLNLSTT